MHPPAEILVVWQLRQAHPRKERPNLQGEVKCMRAENHQEAPGKRPHQQHLGRSRRPFERLRQNIFRSHQSHHQQHRHAPEGFEQSQSDRPRIHRLASPGHPREEGQQHDHHQILHQQNPNPDPTVKTLQLAFFLEQFHHHHRAAERQRHREEGRLHQPEPKRRADPEPKQCRQPHLSRTGDERHFPHIPHLANTQLKPD